MEGPWVLAYTRLSLESFCKVYDRGPSLVAGTGNSHSHKGLTDLGRFCDGISRELGVLLASLADAILACHAIFPLTDCVTIQKSAAAVLLANQKPLQKERAGAYQWGELLKIKLVAGRGLVQITSFDGKPELAFPK